MISTNAKTINLLAVSGSLRKTSSNRNILLAAAELAPEYVSYTIYEDLETLPPFNPDKEEGDEAVRQWRQRVKDADGILICTPEYAFGVPGALKNALDWLVSSGELNDKPVAAISASPLPAGGDKALASLLWTLKALGTRMTIPASAMNTICHPGTDTNPNPILNLNAFSIPAAGKKINERGELTDPATRQQLGTLLEALTDSITNPH
ncbi:MAG: NAD(P)H-dependent oxidoreductase [Puia sp.]|nr:NAD(P)H-dependent oxidoreductase [Puia sp.]